MSEKLVIDLNIFINENKKMLDKEQEIKANFWEMLGKHWWRLLAIVGPIVGALYEAGIYLRNLPPMVR